MCGIAGKLNFARPVARDVLTRMCAAMEHRGPDARGIWCDGGIGLGMQRLAIIDRAGGDQPIFNEARDVAVVMNGEIYNFLELRSQLVDRGHRFSTHSDTEVLVHLYEEHGERLVEHLRGMFAFAIWDARTRRLLLGRDRAGKKPLFLARCGAQVSFASELGALLQDPDVDRTPDPQAIADYLAYQYVPHPRSAFAAIEKLPPACTMSITDAGAETRRYWQLDYECKDLSSGRDELAHRLRELIWEATRVRLISEVPLGAFLSGGIDSSAIVAAMADQMAEPVKTFSIGFTDTAFDELHYARMIAKQFATDHHEFVVEPSALEIMPALARHYGEPFADPSAIPSFYLAKMTSPHVTVALNGDGGDESFAGYDRYYQNKLAARFDVLPPWLRQYAFRLTQSRAQGRPSTNPVARAQRFARALVLEPSARYAHWMSAFQSFMRPLMFQPDFLAATSDPTDARVAVWERMSAADLLDQMLSTDVETYLPADLLTKIDIATMAYSVEGRSPLLDHHLMEFAASVPSHLKLDGRNGKVLLKAALRGVVPDDILDRPKMGFGVPLIRWFRNELRELPGEMLLGSDSRVHRYIKPEAISNMIAEHHAGMTDHSHRLWVLLQLEMWHREVVEAPVLPQGSAVVGAV